MAILVHFLRTEGRLLAMFFEWLSLILIHANCQGVSLENRLVVVGEIQQLDASFYYAIPR